jgi:succinate dehydrogenase / fumarate reductase, membrane anchor subunit
MSEIKLHPTPSPTETKIRTPLARVRGLGSAKEGADHFWKQRVTAISNTVLVIILGILMVRLVGADYASAKATMQKPAVAILFLLLVLSGIHHMRLGMQTIIEDYVHGGARILALMANSFFAYTVGLTCIFAVMKLAFGR